MAGELSSQPRWPSSRASSEAICRSKSLTGTSGRELSSQTRFRSSRVCSGVIYKSKSLTGKRGPRAFQSTALALQLGMLWSIIIIPQSDPKAICFQAVSDLLLEFPLAISPRSESDRSEIKVEIQEPHVLALPEQNGIFSKSIRSLAQP